MKTINSTVKTGLITVLFLAMSVTGFSQLAFEKAPLAIAEISLETTTLDYGVIEKNSDGTRTIQFTNTGDAPLIITKVKSTCGCTVPSFSKTPVMPNEKGEITVKYDTKRIGKFSKNITITSNANTPQQTFKITGMVTE